MKKILKRSEVNINETWDLTQLFKSKKEFNEKLNKLIVFVNDFEKKYQNNLKEVKIITEALHDFKIILADLDHLRVYANLLISEDQTNEESAMLYGKLVNEQAKILEKLSFVRPELFLLEEKIIKEAQEFEKENELYLAEILREKPHSLNEEQEKVLASFSQVLTSFYDIYNKGKLSDMDFGTFEVEGKEYPLSFVLFENEWEFEEDTKIRRKAYEKFYQTLSQYENIFAANYQAHVLTEKAKANLKGFDSVIDYLLFGQKVSREMYDRQIDLIMTKLAPAMRKYVGLLKKANNLDKMTYKDLKIQLDPEFEPDISVAETKEKILDGLSILGDDYLEMVQRAFDERWIDFPQNSGKSTGAFCSSPYLVHPYILISWTKRMRELFVLSHELGHAGHFYFAGKNQNIFNVRPSLYFIEAPSTMNEMLMANKLLEEVEDKRMKRWILASLISRTYYHNFVTHLLEAAYQREVYRLVDAGKPLTAKILNKLKLNVIKEFWGDEVEIDEFAGLTWMRQPHYFMGLYPYTYSAGLTIATCVSEKLINKEIDIEQWKEVLKAGGTKDPVALAKMVDVDLTTSKPLLFTIEKISKIIDEIEELS